MSLTKGCFTVLTEETMEVKGLSTAQAKSGRGHIKPCVLGCRGLMATEETVSKTHGHWGRPNTMGFSFFLSMQGKPKGLHSQCWAITAGQYSLWGPNWEHLVAMVTPPSLLPAAFPRTHPSGVWPPRTLLLPSALPIGLARS